VKVLVSWAGGGGLAPVRGLRRVGYEVVVFTEDDLGRQRPISDAVDAVRKE